MTRDDYIRALDGLGAPESLRGRIASLEVRQPEKKKRHIGRWVGLCACAAVAVVGIGTLDRSFLGGGGTRAGSGGGGHDEGSVFMSYAGPVFPLTTVEDAELTAQREITLDFSPWVPVWISNEEEAAARTYATKEEYQEILDTHNEWFPEGGYYRFSTDILVNDSYVLTNDTQADQTVTLAYPFAHRFYDLEPPTLTLDGVPLSARLLPGVDGDQSLGSWEEYSEMVRQGDLAAARSDVPTLDTPVIVYSFTDLTCPESDAAAPTLAVTFSWSQDSPKLFTYGFNGYSIDREAGWFQHDFFIPEPGSLNAEDPRLLVAVGGDPGPYTIQGYRDGGCDPGEELDGVSAQVMRCETTLGEVLRQLAEEFLSQRQRYEGEVYGQVTLEEFYAALCKGLGQSIPENVTMLEEVLSWVNVQQRIFYLTAEITIPAGETVTVEASFAKEGSYDHYCAHTENQGVYGYDVVTRLGSTLDFTDLTAGLEHTGPIQIVRQNFGFDLERGITQVALDPEGEHYYLEVRRRIEES